MLLPAIPLLVILAAFGALILAVSSRAVATGFVSWLQNAGRVAQFFGGITADIAVKLTRWITHNVGAEWHDLERLAVTWVSGLYQWADLVVTNALEWPKWLWQFQNWLLFTEIPRIYRAIPHFAASVVHTVTTRVVRVERTVVKLPKLSKAAAAALVSAAVAKWVAPYLTMLRWLRAHFHALTAVLPRALPLPNVPAIPNLWKRVRALEKKVAVPLAIGVVVAAIARLGFGWVRCNKVRRIGKAACGLDDGLLNSLLLDATAIFSIVSVVEFAKEMRAVEGEAIGLMGKLVREWPN